MDRKGLIFVVRLTYKILRYIERSHTPSWADVLNHFRPKRWVNRTDLLLRAALDKGFVQFCDQATPPLCRVKLTPAGEIAIQEYIETDRNWCTNEIRAWFTLALSIISFALSAAALIPH